MSGDGTDDDGGTGATVNEHESGHADRPTDESWATDDPGDDPDDPTAPDAPGPDAGSIPLALTVSLAVVSALTAGTAFVAHDAPVAAAGALGVALAFLAIALVQSMGVARPLDTLAAGWDEHRRPVWLATGLFALGLALGGALFATGVDLTELFAELLLEEFDQEELEGENGIDTSATFFVVNNTPPFLAAIAGALTLGLLTVLIMVVNGVLVGNIGAATGAEFGVGPVLALLVPHGVFELPALFVASGVGFRLLVRGAQRVRGTREALFTRSYLRRTAVLVGFAWLVLVLAAFVEAYVTEVLAELLFPSLGE